MATGGEGNEERARELFRESAEVKRRSADGLAPEIARAAGRIAAVLRGEGKVLACGNGGSAADAQHFVGELVNRFERERPPLGAIALGTNPVTVTATANDYAFQEIYAKEVRALGRSGDLLLAISTSGRSPNITAAAEAAQHAGLDLIVLTGGDGGELAGMAQGDRDVVLTVNSRSTARIQEVHILVLHALCELLDRELFGKPE